MRIIAQIISYTFHPLLMVTYGLAFLMYTDPYAFGSLNMGEKMPVLVFSVFVLTFFLPGFSVVMMKYLGMVENLQLKDKQQRTIPYITTGIFYLWLCANIYYNQVFPRNFEIYVFGATIALFVAFFINIFSKISMHTIGLGGLVALVLITMLVSYENLEAIFLGVIVIAGLVGTCRMYLEAHIPNEIYGGYLVGFVCQFIALRILF